MNSIDLGKKCGTEAYTSPKEDGDKVYYPSLYLEGTGDLKDLPESGTLTVSFKRVSQSVTERDGKKRCSVELEIREIIDAEKGDTASDDDEDGSDALDKLAAELSEDDEDDEDDNA